MEKGLYKAGRGERGVDRTPFHVRLDEKQREKLEKLSRKMKMTGADVVRRLIEEAR